MVKHFTVRPKRVIQLNVLLLEDTSIHAAGWVPARFDVNGDVIQFSLEWLSIILLKDDNPSASFCADSIELFVDSAQRNPIVESFFQLWVLDFFPKMCSTFLI